MAENTAGAATLLTCYPVRRAELGGERQEKRGAVNSEESGEKEKKNRALCLLFHEQLRTMIQPLFASYCSEVSGMCWFGDRDLIRMKPRRTLTRAQSLSPSIDDCT